MKKVLLSPLFLPIVSAPILFGIYQLFLLLPEDYEGAWFYVLYYLLQAAMTALFFIGLHRTFCAAETRGFPRALTAAIPILTSLSVYHFGITFYEYYVVSFEEAPTSLLYAFLAFVNDSLFGEWLLLLLTASAACLFFLRKNRLKKTAAWLFSSAIYLAYRLVGEIAEFVSYLSAHFGVAGEQTVRSFIFLIGGDILISAFGFLVLFLANRAAQKSERKALHENGSDLPSLG